ncbi:MAG TPA: hypothetical protein VFL93_14700 [Longimicrobiaceae bacterium]|nr:hypothetical protein [Longimicrobiaceae bacterium]
MKKEEEHKSPIPSRDQDYPEEERMTTPEELAGQELEELEDPPQAEGSREDVEEDLKRQS